MDNPPINQRSGDDMVYEAYRYELTIEKTLDIKSFFFPKNGVEYIFFESDDFAMIFSYQIREGLAKHEPLWGRCATGRSAVLDFGCRVPDRKTKKTTTYDHFFWFSTFWWDFLVNMAWSCWKGLWICIKWTFWWQPFILGPKMYPMMVHGFCTRPIAYIHIDRWLDPSVFRCRRDVRWFGCQVQPVAGAPNGPNGLAQASH